MMNHLWDVSTGCRVEEVVSHKLETSTSTSVPTFVIEILHSVDELSAVQVVSECKFNSGGRQMIIVTQFCNETRFIL